jgi:hypothetical protein
VPTRPAQTNTPTQQRAEINVPALAPAVSTLPTTGPDLSSELVLASTLIAAGVLLGLAGLLQRRARGARHGG